MRPYRNIIEDFEFTKKVAIATISFAGDLETRRDIREKLVMAYESWGFKFLSYEDIDATGKEMGRLRFSRKR